MKFVFETEVLFRIVGSAIVTLSAVYQTSKAMSLETFWVRFPSFIFPLWWAVTITAEFCIWISQLICIKYQAKRTVQLMEDLEKAVGKSNLPYKQVELFSLQVYVEDFKFSLFGCFPLDWTLLHSMAAGVATYLVIFHQFSNIERNA
ncbi:hypothetical protein FQR65_LT15448 [Abscondita terminalis]|nr:hypothetical protein FQR65_LT15448 [Abscondita terminalis]